MKTETLTNEQILKQAIMIAKKKGYKFLNVIYDGKDTLDTAGQSPEYYFHLIFSHDFAKKFWGEDIMVYEMWDKRTRERHTEINDWPQWKFHLQQMVLEPEPLKYLERFL